MFTTVAWNETIAGTTGYTGLVACADEHVRVSGDIVYVPELNNLIGYVYFGQTIATGAYFKSPSLRAKFYETIGQIPLVAQPGVVTYDVFFPQDPIALEKDEGLELYHIESTTTSQVRTGVAFLSDGALSPVDSNIMTVRGTLSITSVIGTWVNSAITFDQTLPVGDYQIVGARCKADSGIAFRFVFVGGRWRPGGLCTLGYGDADTLHQRKGGLGVWGEFNSLTPPTVEIVAGTAAAQNGIIYLDLLKVG